MQKSKNRNFHCIYTLKWTIFMHTPLINLCILGLMRKLGHWKWNLNTRHYSAWLPKGQPLVGRTRTVYVIDGIADSPWKQFCRDPSKLDGSSVHSVLCYLPCNTANNFTHQCDRSHWILRRSTWNNAFKCVLYNYWLCLSSRLLLNH